jgi:hypothetical protein
MKHQSALRWLIPLIGILSLIAAGAGLFYQSPGQPFAFTSHRGENVMIYGQGLYSYDTVSSAAQAKANDFVTLVLGLPLLAFSTWLAFRGSLRGQLLLTGTLGFFLYTYVSMAFLAAFNVLFLMYTALYSLSLFAFVLSMMSFDMETLPGRFLERLPRGWIAGLLFFVAGFLLLAWLGRILPPLFQGQAPLLENATTMVIQAMDLGLILPLAVLSGVLLLRRSAWGFLLASVALMKGMTMGIAVSAMGINMALAGVPESLGILGPFMLITLLNLVMVVVLLRNISPAETTKAG